MATVSESEAEAEGKRRKRHDLDSVLDAALDELDDDSDSDNGGKYYSCGDVVHNSSAANAAPPVPVPAPPGSDTIFSCGDVYGQPEGGPRGPIGTPYSREYIKNSERRRAEGSKRPQFGPEPPPPLDHAAAEEAELAASLEGMMKQFTDNLEGGGCVESDKALEEMFRRMIVADEGVGGAIDKTPRSGRPSRKNEKSNVNDINDPPPCEDTARGKSNSPAPRKSDEADSRIDREPNVDGTISRLLDGINQAASAPIPENMPPEMAANIDPDQLAKMGEEMMNSIMGDFEKLGSANDGNDVVDGVMKQLLDKDLMYEPMREVCARFPKWLAENKDELSEEEYNRHGEQYRYFQRIVRVYETEPDNFPRLMELMQDIQEYGQPPADIIRELAPELEFDDQGMPVMDPGGMAGMPGMPSGGGIPFLGGEQCCIS